MDLTALAESLKFLKSDVYLVGGGVRDLLRGAAFTDADLVLKGAKNASSRLARRLKAKRIVLDERHQIYRLILPSPPPLGTSAPRGGGDIKMIDLAEMTSRSIEEDLGRRDFTINSMALPLITPSPLGGEGGVRGLIDPYGGMRDLKKGILRAVTKKTFQDDPLRRLRTFRFMAQLDFKVDPLTLKWVKAEGYGNVAPERLRQEWMHLMAASRSTAALKALDACGLLTPLFPSLEACRRTAVRFYGQGGVLKHALASVENLEWILERTPKSLRAYLDDPVGGYPRVALLKTAALLHDVGKPGTAELIKGRMRFFGHEHVGADLAFDELERLRFSRQEALTVRQWVKNHMRLGNLAASPAISEKAVSRFFRDLGDDGIGMLLISLGDHYAYLSRRKWGKGTDPVERAARRMLTAYLTEKERVIPPRLIDGHQLMKALKLKPGPLIGKLLAAIQDAQASAKVKTSSDALALARRRLLPKGKAENPARSKNSD